MKGKENIPVYHLCSLQQEAKQDDLQVERFGEYLERHYTNLHHPHRHSFYHMVLFSKGRGTHTIDFTRYTVTPGQLYCMVPGQVHSWHFTGDTDGYILNFSEHFFRSFLLEQDYLDRFSFFGGESNAGVLQLNNTIYGKAEQLFGELITLSAGSPDPDLLRVLLLQLLLTVNENGSGNGTDPQQQQMVLKRFRKLVSQHYQTLRMPGEYAELLHVTPNYLNALCKELLGVTAGELIRNRVLLEAKRLLTNAGMQVAEVAAVLNFKDNSYFNRFFRKYTGQTPETFRKQLYHS
ncbi:AraC family transcriptional regulator [Sediminibacterium ginsengisoli]|uniref:AraC-type DNA-binding protein n=1 Tax=Sediminibacterium ginsengisoli TaxID=413434 RepID=A0A1T4NVZ1_9BACT|nr:helix-turn-helix transcriptional regulator [Sediminibacterium ginsengisoli]SJZ83202.1 AraC-type DNA-binding protein [Sediminibacterium ginsengisoli]